MGDNDPIIRGHAAWALGRIGGPDARATLAGHLATEADAQVADELRRAYEESEKRKVS